VFPAAGRVCAISGGWGESDPEAFDGAGKTNNAKAPARSHFLFMNRLPQTILA
jgi:hypothetical protein